MPPLRQAQAMHRDITETQPQLDNLSAEPMAVGTEYDRFSAFCDQVEELMAIPNIDGREDADGYSLDSVYSAWLANFTAAEYAAGKRIE